MVLLSSYSSPATSMPNKYVKLQWYKAFANTKTEATGDNKSAAGLVVLEIDEKVADHFNIPASATYPADAAPVSKVTGSERAKTGLYLNPAEEGGTIITPDYFRLAGAKNSRDKVARVKSGIQYTTKASKKAFRTVGIPFPLWFDTLMISQALGTMLKANQPGSYSISGGRSGYPILYSETGALLTYDGSPIDKGAWAIAPTATAVEKNTEDLGQVGKVTPVKPPKSGT